MKNLKKVLALVLAFACAFTMFAGAAFTDQESISENNSDAVDLLTTLKIIQGYEDGSFKPEETVTRAQMAKMIYTIRNGGNDDASAYEKVTTTFEDLGEVDWAKGYIKYLQNTGIIAGYSDTVFAPAKVVTTGEALKMALVLGGYRADKAELTGSKWLNNTVSLATTNGLTRNVKSGISDGCSRQDAAQILANVLEMTAVQWSEFVNGFVNDSKTGLSMGGEKITVGNKWMDLTTYIGTLVSSGDLAINYKDSNNNTTIESAGKDKVILSVNTVDGENWYNYRTAGYYGTRWQPNLTFKDGLDHTDLVGQEVKVLVGKNYETVYGVYATGKSKVVEATFDKIDWESDKKLKIDGVKYDTRAALVYTDNKVYDKDASGNKVAAYIGKAIDESALYEAKSKKVGKVSDIAKIIDSDDDGKYETIITKTVAVSEIVSVTSTGISLSAVGSRDMNEKNPEPLIKNNTVIEFEDNTIYEGAAKGDYAVVTMNLYDSNYIVEKAAIVSGVVNGKVDNERKVRVDGNWYTLANNQEGKNKTNLTDPGDLYTIDESRFTFENNDAITLVVVNGIAYNAKSTMGNDKNRSVLMVYAKKYNTGGWNEDTQAKVILANGDKYTVNVVDDATSNGVKCLTFDKLKVGGMYYYEINNDGDYAFYKLDNTNKMLAGYTRVDNHTGIDKNDEVNGQAISDDAIVFALLVKGGSDNGSEDVLNWENTDTEQLADRYDNNKKKNRSLIYDIDANTTYDAKVYSGKTVKDSVNNDDWTWPNKKYEGVGQYLTEKDNGFNYARILNIRIDESKSKTPTTTTHYGYLIEDAVRNRVNGQWRMEYKFWNGTTNESAFEVTDTDRRGALQKHDIISYSYVTTAGRDGAEGTWSEIKDAEAPVDIDFNESGKLTYAAITGADSSHVQLTSTTYGVKSHDVDSNTIIYYVNSDASDNLKIGTTGTGFDWRVTAANGVYPVNCAYILDNDNDVKFLVIDVDNELNHAGSLPEIRDDTGRKSTYPSSSDPEITAANDANHKDQSLKHVVESRRGDTILMRKDLELSANTSIEIPNGVTIDGKANTLTINSGCSLYGPGKAVLGSLKGSGTINTTVEVMDPQPKDLDALKGGSNARLIFKDDYVSADGFMIGGNKATDIKAGATFLWNNGHWQVTTSESVETQKVTSATDLDEALEMYKNVELTEASATVKDINVGSGKTLTVSGSNATVQNVTVENGGKVEFTGSVADLSSLDVKSGGKVTFKDNVTSKISSLPGTGKSAPIQLNGTVVFEKGLSDTNSKTTIEVGATGDVTFSDGTVNAHTITVDNGGKVTLGTTNTSEIKVNNLTVNGTAIIGTNNIDEDINIGGSGTVEVTVSLGETKAKANTSDTLSKLVPADKSTAKLKLIKDNNGTMGADRWIIGNYTVQANDGIIAPRGTYEASSQKWKISTADSGVTINVGKSSVIDKIQGVFKNIRLTSEIDKGTTVTVNNGSTLTLAPVDDAYAVRPDTTVMVLGTLEITQGKTVLTNIKTAGNTTGNVEFGKNIGEVSYKDDNDRNFFTTDTIQSGIEAYKEGFAGFSFVVRTTGNGWRKK